MTIERFGVPLSRVQQVSFCCAGQMQAGVERQGNVTAFQRPGMFPQLFQQDGPVGEGNSAGLASVYNFIEQRERIGKAPMGGIGTRQIRQ